MTKKIFALVVVLLTVAFTIKTEASRPPTFTNGDCEMYITDVKAKSESIVNEEGKKSYAIKCNYVIVHKGEKIEDKVYIHFVLPGQFYFDWHEAYRDIFTRMEKLFKEECEKKKCNEKK